MLDGRPRARDNLGSRSRLMCPGHCCVSRGNVDPWHGWCLTRVVLQCVVEEHVDHLGARIGSVQEMLQTMEARTWELESINNDKRKESIGFALRLTALEKIADPSCAGPSAGARSSRCCLLIPSSARGGV